MDSKRRGTKLTDNSIKISPKELMNKRFPIRNPMPYLLLSYFEEENKQGKPKVFIRIWGCFETQKEAEQASADAFSGGFNYFDLCVVDSRGWLPFPPDKFEKTSQAEKKLNDIFSQHIANTVEDAAKVADRARNAKPTTPTLSFQEKVAAEAIKLLQHMKGGKKCKDAIADIKKSFDEYRDQVTQRVEKETKEKGENINIEELVKPSS